MPNQKEVILTETQRRYLSGEKDVTPSNARNKDSDIRENSYAAVYDLAHLYRHGEDKHFSPFAEGWESQEDDPITTWKAGPSIRSNRTYGAEGSAWEGEELSTGEENPDTTSTGELWLEHIAEELEYDKAKPETQEALVDAVAFICRAADRGELKISEVLEEGAERYLKNRPNPHAVEEGPETLFEEAESEQLNRDKPRRLEIEVKQQYGFKDTEEP